MRKPVKHAGLVGRIMPSLSRLTSPASPGMSMTRPHDWWECEPVLLETRDCEDNPFLVHARVDLAKTDALTVVWRYTSVEDKKAFHRGCCLGDRSAYVDDAVDRILAVMKEMGI